jgi:hypothetical protein
MDDHWELGCGPSKLMIANPHEIQASFERKEINIQLPCCTLYQI